MSIAGILPGIEKESLTEILNIKAAVYRAELKAGLEQGVCSSELADIDSLSYDELVKEYEEMVQNIKSK